MAILFGSSDWDNEKQSKYCFFFCHGDLVRRQVMRVCVLTKTESRSPCETQNLKVSRAADGRMTNILSQAHKTSPSGYVQTEQSHDISESFPFAQDEIGQTATRYCGDEIRIDFSGDPLPPPSKRYLLARSTHKWMWGRGRFNSDHTPTCYLLTNFWIF